MPLTHFWLFWHVAPLPPQVPGLPEHMVLSVQSALARQDCPRNVSKHRPPVHFPLRQLLSVAQVVPGQAARQVFAGDPLGPEQLPLWHWVSDVHGAVLP